MMSRVATRRHLPHRQLQELRINAGLSPNDLGFRIGVSGKTIRLAEQGFTPSPRTQFLIAQEFELAPLDLWPLERQRVPA